MRQLFQLNSVEQIASLVPKSRIKKIFDSTLSMARCEIHLVAATIAKRSKHHIGRRTAEHRTLIIKTKIVVVSRNLIQISVVDDRSYCVHRGIAVWRNTNRFVHYFLQFKCCNETARAATLRDWIDSSARSHPSMPPYLKTKKWAEQKKNEFKIKKNGYKLHICVAAN